MITTYILYRHMKDTTNWVKFNVEHKGYYLVNYSVTEWLTFADLLKNNVNTLAVADRAGLLHDAFALACAGQLDFKVALDLLGYMAKSERELAPWQVSVQLIPFYMTEYF